jgi:parallel beta-helix repeat protein
MKRIFLRLVVAVASATFLTTGTAAAADNPILGGESSATGVVGQLLPTGLDPLLADTAVTDEQLAVAGVWVNNVPTLLSDPNLFIVDDDLAQCPNAQFQTINAAVVAALPGQKIRVCPGLYKESVPITKAGLVLQAPRHQGQATECQAPSPADPTQVAVLLYNDALNGGNPSEGFDVEAPDVTIEGFTVQPDPTEVTANGVGIFTSRNFAGYDIRHNVVQRNTIGVYFNSNGSSQSYVRENCIRENTLGGASSGNGVYSDQGLSNAKITDNSFRGHDNAAVVIDSFLTTPHDVEIVHNESIDDAGIFVFNSAQMTINYNKVVNPVGSGLGAVVVDGGSISSNNLTGGAASLTGLLLFASDNFRAQSNKIAGFVRGLRLRSGSTNNEVATNRITNNRLQGLQATEQSSNNTIRENHMRGNTPDCYDDTSGAGTAGTANLWINDGGDTENRPGLCKHATP